jgi:hypothetical protein
MVDRQSPALVGHEYFFVINIQASPLRGWAHPAHICAGTGLTPPTSAPELGSPRSHLP